MKRFLAVLALSACPALATNLAAQVAYGHRLPEGPERPVRERSYHIESYKAELAFDMEKETIAGTATITFQALRAPLATLSLDAADLAVTKVERGGRPQKFSTDTADFKLDVALDPPVAIGEIGDRRDRVLREAADRHVLLSEVRKAPAAGVELRRGRAPPRAGFRFTTTRTTASRSSSS